MLNNAFNPLSTRPYKSHWVITHLHAHGHGRVKDVQKTHVLINRNRQPICSGVWIESTCGHMHFARDPHTHTHTHTKPTHTCTWLHTHLHMYTHVHAHFSNLTGSVFHFTPSTGILSIRLRRACSEHQLCTHRVLGERDVYIFFVSSFFHLPSSPFPLLTINTLSFPPSLCLILTCSWSSNRAGPPMQYDSSCVWTSQELCQFSREITRRSTQYYLAEVNVNASLQCFAMNEVMFNCKNMDWTLIGIIYTWRKIL